MLKVKKYSLKLPVNVGKIDIVWLLFGKRLFTSEEKAKMCNIYMCTNFCNESYYFLSIFFY